jgi:peptidoglycan/LPS O-acetylase OafA/YrhL
VVRGAPDHRDRPHAGSITVVDRPPAVRERNHGLDGLRGVAALSVALGHCVLQVTGLTLWATSVRDFPAMAWPDIGMRVLSSLLPSNAAVMVFFVLSGHVLYQSFQRKELRLVADLPDYAAARIYRLFPLVIVSALPLGLMIDAPAAELVRNMLLLSHSLNGVLWSLQVEVIASFALFAVWGLAGESIARRLLALVISFALVPFFRGQIAVLFFPAFILGASISSVPQRLWHSKWLLGAGTIVLVFSNLLLGHSGINRGFEMAGATALVGCVASGRLRFLQTRSAQFLGAISYPFYLTHPVGLAVAEPIVAALPPMPRLGLIAAYAVLSIALTIPLAWLLHVFIEDPVLRARPRLARWSARAR